MDRFKREAQVSAQLKHPNIVTIYDVGDVDGMSYLAMEFIDGIGLDRAIAGAGRLTTERAAGLGAQVADALDFAHRHNVVHRDIKPANIMIEAGDRVKVTDFGIAKVMDSADHLTQTGSLLGTPVLHEPRAGPRQRARRAQRPLRGGLHPLRDADRQEGLPRRLHHRPHLQDHHGGAAAARGPRTRTSPTRWCASSPSALAKQADERYQTGRELADDLLALTRPGSSPTLRQTEVATAPGSWPPRAASAPTIATAAHRRGHGAHAADHAGARRGEGGPARAAARRLRARRPASGGRRPGRARRSAAPAKSRTGVIVGAVGGGPAPGRRPRGRRGLVRLRAQARHGGATPAPPRPRRPRRRPPCRPRRSRRLPRPRFPKRRPPASVPNAPATPPAAVATGPGPAARPPAATGPAAAARPGADAGARPPARQAAPPQPADAGAHSSYSVLDEEPAAEADGRQAGEAPGGQVPRPGRQRLRRLRGHGPLSAAGAQPAQPHAVRAAGGGHAPAPHRQARRPSTAAKAATAPSTTSAGRGPSWTCPPRRAPSSAAATGSS